MTRTTRHLFTAALGCCFAIGSASAITPDSESWPDAPTKNAPMDGEPLSGAPMEDTPADERIQVETELALIVDISGSVDADEYRLQIEGYANAFRAPIIQHVIENGDGVGVAFYRWSSTTQQTVTRWHVLRTAEDCELFADVIERQIDDRPFADNTIMAQAIRRATLNIESNNLDGRNLIIDVSGDGVCENWFHYTEGGTNLEPKDVELDPQYGYDWFNTRRLAENNGVIINAISIGESEDLKQWYKEHVPLGTGSFARHADDFEEFGVVIQLKLLRELQAFLQTSHD